MPSSNSPTPSSPRSRRSFSRSPEPRSVASSRLGQPLRRVGPRANRRRSSAGAARPPSACWKRSNNARLRRGRERVASLRRRVQPRARLLLPSFSPLGRPAHRGRMGLPVHRTAQLRARELDRPHGRGARPSRAGRQRGGRRAGQSVSAPVARGGEGRSPVRLRRWLRSRQAAAGAGGDARARSSSVCARGVASTPTRASLVRPRTPDGRVATGRR